MWVLPFLNNTKDLDLSYKTDLNIWDCFEGNRSLAYKHRHLVDSDEMADNEPPHIGLL